jgi:protein-disulfide isomerase
MSRNFWFVIIAIVLVFVGLFSFGGSKTTSHIQGLGKSGITLVEYGDYECPYCKVYAPVVKQIQQEFNDQIFVQFRNYPLTNAHVNAFAAARAAEAASLQNKFWEMHDALYNPSNWAIWTPATDPTTYFKQYATAIGLNLDQFNTDFGSTKVNDYINNDKAAGDKLNLTGTPSYYLDGVNIPNNKLVDGTNQPSVEAFAKVINDAIAKKSTK